MSSGPPLGAAFQAPKHTYSAENYIEDFFRKRPTDGQFKGYDVLNLKPSQGLNDTPANLSPLVFTYDESPSSVMPMINNMSMTVSLRLTDAATKQKPADNAVVSVSNNILNTLFEDIDVMINGQNVNKKTEKQQHYISAIGRYLSYNTAVKSTVLTSGGWVDDDPETKEDWAENSTEALGCVAFMERRTNFTQVKDGTKFRKGLARFVGTVDYELSSLPSGIPPGMKCVFTFHQTKHVIRICQPKDVTKKYYLTIEDMVLHLPICHLSENSYVKLKKQLNVTPAKLHYTRSDLRNYVIKKGATQYSGANLFQNSIIPVRVYVAFVDHDAFMGNVNKDPF